MGARITSPGALPFAPGVGGKPEGGVGWGKRGTGRAGPEVWAARGRLAGDDTLRAGPGVRNVGMARAGCGP